MGMVKMAGVALMLVAAQAFAASTVDYTVELSPYNSTYVANYKAGGTARTYFTADGTFGGAALGNAADNQQYPAGGIVTWDLKVAVSGNHSQAGHPSDGKPVAGLANLVFNVQLEKQNGANWDLVSIGAGSPTSVGWYSAINDGTGGTPVAAAAMALSYNVGNAGPGRAIDARNDFVTSTPDGGPKMGLFTYPTVVAGKLLGQGCGYTAWDQSGASQSMTAAGVGMTTITRPTTPATTAPGLGIRPICEGQINTTGLATGTYRLKVTKGAGVNVLRGDLDLYILGAPSFAVAANVVNEDTIVFQLVPPVPTIALAPSSISRTISAGQTLASETFNISNPTGNLGTTLNYNITESVSWLSVAPASGIATTESDAITITYDTAGLAPGTYDGAISIAATGASNTPQTLPVHLVVQPAAPVIVASSTAINRSVTLYQSLPSDQIQITNGGGAGSTLNFSVTFDSDEGWLWVDPMGGSVTTGSVTLTVQYFGANLLALGQYTGSIVIAAAGATNSPMTIPVNLTVHGPAPTISLSLASLNRSITAGQTLANDQFTISNTGASGSQLDYTVSATSDGSWLAANPVSGSVTTGSAPITVSYPGASALGAGTYNGTITVTASWATNTPQTIPVQLVVEPLVTTGSLSVVIGGTPPAGAGWSITGGAPFNASGAVLADVAAGNYSVTFAPVVGYTAPADVQVGVSAGLQTDYTSEAYVLLATPVVSGGAVSRQFHTGAVNSYIDLPLFAGMIPTSGSVAVEPRRSGSANPWTIAVTFDMALGAAPTVTATGSNGTPTLGAPTVVGNVLEIPITASNDVNLITLSVTDVTSAAGSLPNASAYVIKVIALQGDVNRNRLVNVGDVNIESTKSGLPVDAVNAVYDINCNGAINVNDINLLSVKTGSSVVGTYP